MLNFRRFTEEELKDIHLSIVRLIGREMGVKSPTALKKEILIANILGIQDGTIKPEINVNKGAPSKMDADLLKPYLLSEEERGDYTKDPYKVKTVFEFHDSEPAKTFVAEGIFEQMKEGYGFLRVNNFENSRNEDVYVSMQNARKFNIRRGDKVKAVAKPGDEREAPALQEVLAINDLEPFCFLKRRNFDDFNAEYSTDRLKLEVDGEENDLSLRCIDLFAPLGMGQRGLIVSAPKTGKTTLLKKIAQSIEKNYPDVKLFLLLIDERPEEVTDIKRSVNAEVVFSTFDESAEHHIKVAELLLNRAKRLVEAEQNVVILMDSITRLARAYNKNIEPSGKTLSGGLDPVALDAPKRFFGSARNIEKGGSLTIISTALVETGSRMDDVIYEEFKSTGNMEIHLSRELSERRIFPAIDLYKSGTRKEELLLTQEELSKVYKLRKVLAERSDSTDALLDMMNKTKTNEEFISKLDAWLKLYQK